MRKALSLALAGLCLAARASPAADFTAGRAAPIAAVNFGAALQTALPALNLPPAELGTLNILAGRFQDASVSLPQLAPQAELTGPAAAQAVLASVTELRAKYSDDQIRNLSAGQLSGIGQALIDRLQGAPSTAGASSAAISPFGANITLLRLGEAVSTTREIRPPAPATSLYLLTKPLKVTDQLGPVGRAGFYAVEAAIQAVKSYLLLRAGVPAAAVGAEFAFSAAKSPAVLSLQSMGYLRLRYWATKLKTLKKLAGVPNVEGIAVLTGTETHFSKVVASSQENRGFIFLRASAPLAADAAPEFGEPLLVADPKAARLRLSFEVAGRKNLVEWTPTLEDLFEQRMIPDEAARAWRADIAKAKKGLSWWKRFFDFKLERALKVEATLVGEGGAERPLGALTQGQATKKLLGITRTDQILLIVKTVLGVSPPVIQTIFSRHSPQLRRSIPLGDSAVEKEVPELSPRDIPARAWRLLTGRLIPAQTPVPAARLARRAAIFTAALLAADALMKLAAPAFGWPVVWHPVDPSRLWLMALAAPAAVLFAAGHIALQLWSRQAARAQAVISRVAGTAALAAAAVAAAALGNGLDAVFRHGSVDFIPLGLGTYMNLADAFVFFGAPLAYLSQRFLKAARLASDEGTQITWSPWDALLGPALAAAAGGALLYAGLTGGTLALLIMPGWFLGFYGGLALIGTAAAAAFLSAMVRAFNKSSEPR